MYLESMYSKYVFYVFYRKYVYIHQNQDSS